MKTNRFSIAIKWFLLVNLVCLALPVLPFLLHVFVTSGLRIKFEFGLWDISRMIFSVPMFSIPLSIVVAVYKVVVADRVRDSIEESEEQREARAASAVFVGFRTFGLSMLLSYGVVTAVVLLVMIFSSDSSLVGVLFIEAMPIALIVSVVAACIRMKGTKAVLLFLMITVLPFLLYKWSYSRWQSEYFLETLHMQRGEPSEADWREFFAKYEDSLFGSKGARNQLDSVLWIGSIPQDVLLKYVDHPDPLIKWSVAKNPSLPEEYMYEYLEGSEYLRRNLAKNPTLPQEIIDQLLSDQEPRVRDAMSEALAGSSNMQEDAR